MERGLMDIHHHVLLHPAKLRAIFSSVNPFRKATHVTGPHDLRTYKPLCQANTPLCILLLVIS